MALLERESSLRGAADYLAEAAAGHGRLVFVGGEAGVGKTTFVDAVVRRAVGPVRFAQGGCDGSSTPAPLGPLREMLPDLPADVWPEGADRHEVFGRLTDAMRLGPPPHLLVLEDAHWADDATLDLVRHLARRVHRLHALVLVTYRTEETVSDHPLRLVLGDVASAPGIRRIDLAPLSLAAVHGLVDAEHGAQHGIEQLDADELHRVTGGNPFYVTEVLAAGGSAVPRSVHDAVLSRVARLSPAAREGLGVVALAGPRAELELVARVAPDAEPGLDEALGRGVLQVQGDALMFRHEMARLTLADEVPALHRIALHRRILAALEELGAADPARMAHHAERAGLGDSVRVHAGAAADRAAALGSHKEAVQQYERVLRYSGDEPPAERARLLARLSYELYITGRTDESLVAREEALAIWVDLGDVDQVGNTQRWLSRLSWFVGRNEDAARYGAEACRTLAGRGSRDEAMAASNRAQLFMLAGDLEQTREWAERAMALLTALPEELEAEDVWVHALNNLGSAEQESGDAERGDRLLADSLERSIAADLHEHAARAFTNLVSLTVRQHRHAEATAWLRQGLDYSLERDLDTWSLYMRGWKCRSLLEQGAVREALAEADAVLRHPRTAAVSRIGPLSVLARGRAWLGRDEWREPLAQALDLAAATAESQRISLAVAAACEIAWIQGDQDGARRRAGEAWAVVDTDSGGWGRGEVATWLADGQPGRLAVDLAPPYLAQVRGEWAEAARLWGDMGSPFARALALARGGSRDQLAEAALLFDDLGADAAAARARALSRAHGWAPPRGPRRATRQHPDGLTARESEVLAYLVDGLPDAAIADRLVLSRRTVEHHVASILAKLGAASRRDVPGIVAAGATEAP